MGDVLPDIEDVAEWVDLPEADHGLGPIPARRVRTFRRGAWAVVPMCPECTCVTEKCTHDEWGGGHQVEHIESRVKGCEFYEVRWLMYLVVALDETITCPVSFARDAAGRMVRVVASDGTRRVACKPAELDLQMGQAKALADLRYAMVR